MRAPAFWNRRPPTWQSKVLAPLSGLYAAATARRIARPAKVRPGVPVICVGNLNAGGTGKTPAALALHERLARMGIEAHIVSRGYGGTLRGPVEVDPAHHDAAQVGDEPLLMSAFAPVWVAADRATGASAAEIAGAQAIVLDDGFQNPDVAKDLSIVVVDATVGFGNGLVIPAGPLREPVHTGLARADAVLAIGNSRAQTIFDAEWPLPGGLEVLRARMEPLKTGLPLAGLRVLAFAGIGRPEKFFETLRDEGADILRSVPLGDHQPLTPALMRRLLSDAKTLGAQLVTTEKDAVRLPQAFRQNVMTIPVRLVFDAPEEIDALLAPILRD